MSLILDGTNGVTFNNSTTQAVAALPLTGGTLTGTTTFTGGVANSYGFGVGTAVPSSGAGISFPATQSASSDANTLDDYEEGTWTVTDTSGAGLSISTGFAIYTKVGDMVNAICDITYPTTSNTNYVLFSLPFAGKNYANGFVGYTNYTTTAIYLENNNNSANMNIFNSSFSSITNANFSGKRIICTFVYKVL